MSKDTKGTKKYIGDIASTKVNIYIYILRQGLLESMAGKTLGDVGKAQFFFQNNKRHNKKTSWVP
jgi:hypothetical protein